MKKKQSKIKAKGKAKTKSEKIIDYVKTVRGIDRELAKENKTFDNWIPKSNVHTDRKKKASKNASRDFKRNKNKFL